MSSPYPLYVQVALTTDFPEYSLAKGAIARIVEHYPMPEGKEDGYSLEGFDIPGVTLEVGESQIRLLDADSESGAA